MVTGGNIANITRCQVTFQLNQKFHSWIKNIFIAWPFLVKKVRIECIAKT